MQRWRGTFGHARQLSISPIWQQRTGAAKRGRKRRILSATRNCSPLTRLDTAKEELQSTNESSYLNDELLGETRMSVVNATYQLLTTVQIPIVIVTRDCVSARPPPRRTLCHNPVWNGPPYSHLKLNFSMTSSRPDSRVDRHGEFQGQEFGQEPHLRPAVRPYQMSTKNRGSVVVLLTSQSPGTGDRLELVQGTGGFLMSPMANRFVVDTRSNFKPRTGHFLNTLGALQETLGVRLDLEIRNGHSVIADSPREVLPEKRRFRIRMSDNFPHMD